MINKIAGNDPFTRKSFVMTRFLLSLFYKTTKL